MYDVIGLGAAVAFGAYAGYHQCQQGPWTVTDGVILFVLLVIAWFFAVVLS